MNDRSAQVDFIVPTYNAEDTIIRTLRSLVSQADPHWAATVIDDGSTDSTAHIARSFGDPRVTVITQANTGPSGARNLGFLKTDAPYACFLDADDTLDPHYIEHMLPAAHGSLCGASCAYSYLDTKNNILCTVPALGSDRLTRSASLDLDPPAIMSILYKRSALNRIAQGHTLFNTSLRAYEDWDMLDRLIHYHPNEPCIFAACRTSLAFYSCTPHSLSSNLGDSWLQGCSLLKLRCTQIDELRERTHNWAIGIWAGCIVAGDFSAAHLIQNTIGPLSDDVIPRFVQALRWHAMRRHAIVLSDTDTMQSSIIARCNEFFDNHDLVDRINARITTSSTLHLEQMFRDAESNLRIGGRIIIYGLGRNGEHILSAAGRTGVRVTLTDDQPTRYEHDPRRIRPESISANDTVIVTPLNSDALVRSLRAVSSCRIIRYQCIFRETSS